MILEPLLQSQIDWIRRTLQHHATSAERHIVEDRGDLVTMELSKMTDVIRLHYGAHQGCWQ